MFIDTDALGYGLLLLVGVVLIVVAIVKREPLPFDYILLFIVFLAFGWGRGTLQNAQNNELSFALSLNFGWIPFFLFLIIFRDQLKDYFLTGESFFPQLALGTIIGLVFGVLIRLFLFGLKELQLDSDLWLMIFTMFIPIALGEELLFRGYFLGKLIKTYEFPYLVVNIIQSLIFLFGHIDQGFVLSVTSFLFAFLFGFYAYQKKSLTLPIAAHTLFNIVLSI